MLQDNNQKIIAANDKDFKENLFKMFDWAALNIIKYEWLINPKKQKWATEAPDHNMQVVLRKLNERYEELAEEFIEDIFEYEARLERSEWENLVASKQSFVLNPADIREKL